VSDEGFAFDASHWTLDQDAGTLNDGTHTVAFNADLVAIDENEATVIKIIAETGSGS
jgi:hypothetical protein